MALRSLDPANTHQQIDCQAITGCAWPDDLRRPGSIQQRRRMRTITEIWKVMSTILLIIVILLLIGALPSWPYSRGWGYYPSGGLGLILVIVLILAVLGRL